MQADTNRLRRIELDSAVVSTISGPPPESPPFYSDGQGTSASFNNIGNVAMNAAGTEAIIVRMRPSLLYQLFFLSETTPSLQTDAYAYTVRHLNVTSGIITTIVGSEAGLHEPYAVAMDANATFALIVSVEYRPSFL